jgi:hypothetical protein
MFRGGDNMKQQTITVIFVVIIAVFASLSSSFGIFSADGEGPYPYTSIREETVEIHGRGIYRHMSADVAVQGIAQDYVTLLLGIPLLLVGLIWSAKGAVKGKLLLAGTLLYFLVTYLFYTCMAMYNYLFLAYVILLACSFLALAFTLYHIDPRRFSAALNNATLRRFAGIFLIVNTLLIALLWLSVVVPPLLDGSIYPVELKHYTTLIVQGLDLGLLLPLGFVIAVMFLKRQDIAAVLMPVYMIFLAILMTALSGKIIAMGIQGANIIPAVFIIPVINIIAIVTAILLLKHIQIKDSRVLTEKD